MFAVEAKKRMAQGGGDKRAGVANLPHPLKNKGKAREQAAEVVSVSPRKHPGASVQLSVQLTPRFRVWKHPRSNGTHPQASPGGSKT